MDKPLDNIRVVLVSPLYSGNVGAACRAMMNMGITDLAIAAPRPEFSYAEARIMACHAVSVLDGRREYPTLAEAVADCGLVAGTTAREGLYRGHARTPRDVAPRLLEAAAAARVALVFGPEDNGISNEDLALCTQIIRLPTSESYPSLNLSHAVSLFCYEIFLATGEFKPPRELSSEAPSAMREQMFKKWRQALLDVGFMEEQKADHMMLGLRRILSRGLLTVDDVNIMIGIARQAQWAGNQAKKQSGGGSDGG